MKAVAIPGRRCCAWRVLGRPMSSQSEVAERLSDRIAELGNEQRRFDYEHQRTIGLTSIPSRAPKSVRMHAEAKPWDGEEHFVEASRRMLEDSIKPLKVSRSQRLNSARENALDYAYNKAEGPTHKERLKTQTPRRSASGSGGAVSGLSSGGWIESIAAQEIENAIARGQFKDIQRGPSAPDSRSALLESSRNAQLDFTEYLLNNIVKKQGGAPPWIMKQRAIFDRIEAFRAQMRLRLQERFVHRLAELGGYDFKRAVRLVDSVDRRDREWESSQAVYHAKSVHDINDQIRGYNLQAPLTARKGYLDVDKEVARCYSQITVGIEDALSKYVGVLHVPKADRGSLHSAMPPLEPPEKHYGLRQLFRDLFR